MPARKVKKDNPETRKPPKLRKARKIDRDEVLKLAGQGMSKTDIAKHQGVTVSCIWKFLDKVSPEYEILQRFKDNSADIHTYDRYKTREQRMRVLQAMEETSDDKIKEIDFSGLTRVQKELKVTESKIEEDEITAREGRPSVTNVHQINIAIGDLDSKLKQLEAEREGR